MFYSAARVIPKSEQLQHTPQHRSTDIEGTTVRFRCKIYPTYRQKEKARVVCRNERDAAYRG